MSYLRMTEDLLQMIAPISYPQEAVLDYLDIIVGVGNQISKPSVPGVEVVLLDPVVDFPNLP